MNIEQTAAILAKVQLGDNREITPLVIREWHDAIGDLEYDDAIEGVRMHRRNSTAYLMPAHVRDGARSARSRREARERAARPRLPRPPITLDREAFERETQHWIEHYRRERAR